MKDHFNDLVRPADKPEKDLMHAASIGDAITVEQLIKEGANIWVESEMPLLLAATNGHLEVVKLLVAEGSLGESRFRMPTYAALGNGHHDVVAYIEHAVKERRAKSGPKDPAP